MTGGVNTFSKGRVLPQGEAWSTLEATMNTPQKPRRPLDDRIQYFAERDSLQDLQALFELEKANAELIRALEAAEERVERERAK
jgi:hypothetical protein